MDGSGFLARESFTGKRKRIKSNYINKIEGNRQAMTERSQKWYHAGLQFKCTGCGDCCTGEPGFVWLDEEEIATLAKLLNMPLEDFQDTYTRRIGARWSLVEYPNGDCVFFDSEKRSCGVYEARPKQCRTWPFWDSNLESPETWQATCRDCPGSGTGPVVSLESIEIQRREVKL